MNNFKMLRKGAKLNQSEFATLLNVSQQTISNWEKGVTEIDLESLKKISDRFKVTIDYLLGKTDSPVDLNSLKWNDNVRPINLQKEIGMGKIPILGAIAAGNPRTAIEENDVDSWVIADMNALGNGLHFGLEITGDSMEPRICENDVAIIRVTDWVNTGDIAAVRVNSEDTTLKKVKFEQNGIWLIGLNPNFKPIYYTAKECAELPVTVIGKLVQVIQRY